MVLDSKGRKKVYILSLGVATLFLLVTALIIPKTEINIELEKSILKQTYQIKLDPSITRVLPALNIIPAVNKNSILNKDLKNYKITKKSNLAYKESDLVLFITKKIESSIKESERIKQSTLKYKVSLDKNNKNKLQIYTECIIEPIVNTEIIKNHIKGKKIKSAINYIADLPNIKSVQYKSYPSKLFFIPFLKSRIKIIYN